MPIGEIDLFHVNLQEQMLLPICDLGERVVFTRPPGAVLLPSTKALFGWAFGFGFWPQKPKAQPKGLLLEGAFSEAAAFP